MRWLEAKSSPMEGTETMALGTALTIPTGHSLDPQDSNVIQLEQQANVPLPWDQSPPPIAVSDARSAATTTGDVGPAIGPAAKAEDVDTKQQVAKTELSRSKTKYVPQSELDAKLAQLEELSQAALAGDTAALDQLRVELDNCPHVWRHLADLQQVAEHKLIELVAGIDPLRVESFRKRCSELRHELLENDASSLLVKMAASRVVMCWMFCQFLELRALEDPQDLRCVKQLEQAERRYQVAMRTFQMARHADLQLQRLAQQTN
jgi:hypothetical protein